MIPPGAYRLQIQGKGGIDFISYYPLNYLEKSYSVLVETDRAVYNPGSKVLFRVLVLDSELKPVGNNQTGSLTIRAVVKTYLFYITYHFFSIISNNPIKVHGNIVYFI